MGSADFHKGVLDCNCHTSAIFFLYCLYLLQCTYPVQFIVPASANKQNNKAATNKPEEKQVQIKENIIDI